MTGMKPRPFGPAASSGTNASAGAFSSYRRYQGIRTWLRILGNGQTGQALES